MPQIVDELNRRQLRVGRPDSFDLDRPDSELRRLTDIGSLLQLSKGFYALVPEDRRRENTPWRPTIEGAALGMAAALYGPESVALIGPSATRAHRCYPRALGEAYVTTPKPLRQRETIVGKIRFVTRDITKMDTVRIETDLGPGWATSIEQTALDLCRDRPAWNITDEARTEMIRRLADRIDWDLIDEIAETTRGVKTLRRLRAILDRPQP
jgi:hypothetical protein